MGSHLRCSGTLDDGDERPARTKRDFATVRETIAEIQEDRFPERGHLAEMEAPFPNGAVRWPGATPF